VSLSTHRPDRAQIDRSRDEPDLSRLNARKVEHVVDLREQLPPAAMDDL
jgi:hypothetical protein